MCLNYVKNLSWSQTYIDCLHLKKTDKSRMQAEDPMETDSNTARSDEETLDYEDKVVNVSTSLLF